MGNYSEIYEKLQAELSAIENFREEQVAFWDAVARENEVILIENEVILDEEEIA